MSRAAISRVSVAAAAVAALGACRHAAAFRCPAEGGPPWVEVESEHFVVKTDAPEGAAERVARDLESLRMAHLAAWDGQFDPPARLEVVVLRNQTELGELLDPWLQTPWARVLGYYALGARPRVVTGLLLDRDQPSLALPPFREQAEARAEVAEAEVLRHELAHHLVGQVLLRQPPWLAEGLAEYLAATRVGTWQGRPAAAVGLAGREAWEADRVPAATLLAWRPGEPGARNYASSWLLVHFLVNRRGAAFADFQRRLARAEDPASAWRASFPDLDPGDGAAMASLDRELDAYLRAPSHPPLRVLLPSIEPGLRRRPLPPAEVHALRAELLLQSLLPPEQARSRAEVEIDASLGEDPTGLWLALLLPAAGQKERALALGRAATEALPGDWRGWVLLAGGADGREDLAAERLRALRRAAALVPEDAWALNDVAWGLQRAGASGEAFPLASRAVRLAPASASVLDTWAAVLADVGRCREALLAQRRAVDLVRSEGPPAGEIREHLAAVEARCGGASPSP